MINKPSTKVVDLAIAWAEGSLSSVRASGPNFQLIGPDNRTYTRASFPSNSVLVVYFGFTTCWRACPTALNAIAHAIEDLGDAAERVQPIFISLDPQREDPEGVDLYLKAFGDRFVGLRGSQDQVAGSCLRIRGFGAAYPVFHGSDRLHDDPFITRHRPGPTQAGSRPRQARQLRGRDPCSLTQRTGTLARMTRAARS